MPSLLNLSHWKFDMKNVSPEETKQSGKILGTVLAMAISYDWLFLWEYTAMALYQLEVLTTPHL